MKAKRISSLGLLFLCLMAMGFTHVFIRSVSADCDGTQSPSNDHVHCADTSDTSLNIDTGNGNDTVSLDNSDVGLVDTGNDDDVVKSSDSVMQLGLNLGSGNDNASLDNSYVSDTIDAGNGDDTIRLNDSNTAGGISAGNGNDKVSITGTSDIDLSVSLGDGNDSLTLSSHISNSLDDDYDIDAGTGNDTVEIKDGAQLRNGIDGGDDTDTLKFHFKVSSKAEKEAFEQQLHANGNTPANGYVVYNGQTYAWTHFEDLLNLLQVIRSHNGSGSSNVTIAVLGDTRLNNQDVAAPVAVYCNAGTIEAWVIGADGQGTLTVSTAESALPQSANGVSIALSGDQVTTTYGGYSFSFPALTCVG